MANIRKVPMSPALDCFEKSGDGRHVPVFKAHPGDGVSAFRRGDDGATVVDRGAHRFLDENGYLGGKNVVEDRLVRVVR